MPSLSVFGAQWGDEGKGKMIDLLAKDADVVVRYQGGANAGHTVVANGEKHVLHLIPSGVLNEGAMNVVANGVSIDPLKFIEEVDGLIEKGVQVTSDNLRISATAHVIFEHHKTIDRLSERFKGDGRIGTTGRGIGPCYADKAARTGLRICDLLDTERLEQRLRATLSEKNALIENVHGEEAVGLEQQYDRYASIGARLAPFVCDTGSYVRRAYADGKRVLFEGAQGIMLDVDHGTYPYVTSSNTGVGGVASGVGFPPQNIERAIGIAKAYCTRVGEGPFPSEETGAIGEAIRKAGNEFGATTGRPRRCGWLDAVALRYGLELSGANGWIMTNLDVLSGFEEISVATSYVQGDEEWSEYPAHLASLEGVEVKLSTRPGWTEDITAIREFEKLPAACREYVEWVEEVVGTPIVMLSVGPSRDQVIARGSIGL